jgi:hypothetical protein
MVVTSLSFENQDKNQAASLPFDFNIRAIFGRRTDLSKYIKHWQAVTTSNVFSGKSTFSAADTK